jgi:hypothetical protein
MLRQVSAEAIEHRTERISNRKPQQRRPRICDRSHCLDTAPNPPDEHITRR